MIIFVIFFVAFLFSCAERDSIPPLQLKTLEDKKLNLKDIKDKKVIIYVWSKTCAGHTKDLKLLNQISKERKDLYIISYAVAMVKEDVLMSYKDIGITPNFQTVLDPEVRFNEYYRIVFLPSTFVFDERGRFINSYPGLPTEIFSSLKSSSSSSRTFSSKLSSGLTFSSFPAKKYAFVKG